MALSRLLQAVLDVMSLSPEDKSLFVSRLDSKDLSATVDQKALIHLLLRAEGRAKHQDSRHPTPKWRRTKVSRVLEMV
jgi:hypothetical protein